MKPLLRLGLLFTVVATSGCQLNPKAVSLFNEHIGPIFGVRLESSAPAPAASPAPSPSSNAPSEEHRRLNAEFIKELYQVVLEREVTQEEFDRWMNVLDQGGSYEGAYNGLANGEEYRARDKGVASTDALRLYAQYMAALTMDEKYDPLKIKISPPKPEPGQLPSDMPPPQPTEEEKKKLISDFATKGVNRSLYSLKKDVAAQALKVMDFKHEYREKFATWFGRFVVSTNSRNVDFGVPGRRNGDEYYHYKWGLEHPEDRIRWEVLNRIHRIFNQAK